MASPPPTISLDVPFEGPLEVEALVGYFAPRCIPGVEEVADGVYRRTILAEGRPAVVELAAGGPDCLRLVVHGADGVEPASVVDRARRLFGLDAPVAAAQAHLAGDPLLGSLV